MARPKKCSASSSSKPKSGSKRSNSSSRSSSSPEPSPCPTQMQSSKRHKATKAEHPPLWLPQQHKCGLCNCIIGGSQSRTRCLESHEWVCEAYHPTVFMLDNWHHCLACSQTRSTRYTKRKDIAVLKDRLATGQKSGDLSKSEIRALERKISEAEDEYQLSVLKTEADTRIRELAYSNYISPIQSDTWVPWYRYWKQIMVTGSLFQLPAQPAEPRPVFGKKTRLGIYSQKHKEVEQYLKNGKFQRADVEEEVDRLFFMWKVLDTKGDEERMLEVPEVIWKLCEEKLRAGGAGKSPKR